MSDSSSKSYPPWSARKLFICRKLLQSTEKRIYPLSGFVFPYHYPHNTSQSWELVRIAKCLVHLEDVGVSVKGIRLNSLEQSAGRNESSFVGRVIRKLPFFQNRRLAEELLSAVQGCLTTLPELSHEGEGVFPLNISELSSTELTALGLLPDVLFELDIRPKRLKHHLNQYLSAYEQDRLDFSPNRLGMDISQQIFQQFLTEISYVNRDVRLQLGQIAGGVVANDIFSAALKNEPRAYAVWNQNPMAFPFMEQLLLAERNGRLNIVDIPTTVVATLPEGFSHAKFLQHVNYSHIPLEGYLNLQVLEKSPARKSEDEKTTITLIQVLATDQPKFRVYFNGELSEYVELDKRNKNGEIIYTVAEEGQFYFSSAYKKALEYIQSNPQFVFFTKTEYQRRPLFNLILDEDQEEVVVPKDGIRCELIQKAPAA